MRKINNFYIILITVILLSGCDATGSGDAELVNVWKVTSIYTDSKGDSETINYPYDLLMIDPDTFSADIDSDGTNESIICNIYIEFSATSIRLFNKREVIDEGSDTTTLAAMGIVDDFSYSSSEDIIYTLEANTITNIESEGDSNTTTFSISGTTLTVSELSDNETPADTSDDERTVVTLSLASNSDIADAKGIVSIGDIENIEDVLY